MNQIEKYAAIGLRTLLLAKKTISEEEYEEWAARRTEAECSLENREKMIDNVNERIEKGMKLVGATAIEDKLQDEVQDTIEFIREAGIKIWVLTGDKIETAVNIAYSTGLLDNGVERHLVQGENIMTIANEFRILKSTFKIQEEKIKRKHALVISGQSLQIIQEKESFKKTMLEFASQMDVVIACRVSP